MECFFDINICIFFLHMAVYEKSVSLINSDAHGYWEVSVAFFTVKYSVFMILAQIRNSWYFHSVLFCAPLYYMSGCLAV